MNLFGPLPGAPPPPPPVSAVWAAAAYLLPGLAAGLLAVVVEALRYFCSTPPPGLISPDALLWVAPALTIGTPLLGFQFARPATGGGRFGVSVLGFVLGTFLAVLLAGADENTLARPLDHLAESAWFGLIGGGVLGVVAAGLFELVVGLGRWVQARVLLSRESRAGDAP